jgi:hypothetical protein
MLRSCCGLAETNMFIYSTASLGARVSLIRSRHDRKRVEMLFEWQEGPRT